MDNVSEDYIGYIYKTTCLVNNKIYIGRHETNKNDNYLGSGIIISKAIKKYGRKNFKRKILRWCKNDKELKIWEYFFIMKFNSTDSKIGYNIAYGDVNTSDYNPAKIEGVKKKISKRMTEFWDGNVEMKEKLSKRRKGVKTSEYTKEKLSKALKGRKKSDETRLKMSKAASGENHWAFGKIFTDEHRMNLSKGIKGKMVGEKHPLFGKKMSEETKKKMSEKQKTRWANIQKNKQ